MDRIRAIFLRVFLYAISKRMRAPSFCPHCLWPLPMGWWGVISTIQMWGWGVQRTHQEGPEIMTAFILGLWGKWEVQTFVMLKLLSHWSQRSKCRICAWNWAGFNKVYNVWHWLSSWAWCGRHMWWKKTEKPSTAWSCSYMESTNIEFIETESRLVVTWGLEVVEMGRCLSKGTKPVRWISSGALMYSMVHIAKDTVWHV